MSWLRGERGADADAARPAGRGASELADQQALDGLSQPLLLCYLAEHSFHEAAESASPQASPILRIRHANAAALAFLPARAEPVAGQLLDAVAPWLAAAGTLAALTGFAAAGPAGVPAISEIVTDVVGRNGSARAEVTGVRWGDDQLLVGITDLGPIDRAEAAVRTYEQRLARLEELTGFGVFDGDLDAGNGTWSPTLYSMLGIDPAVPASVSLYMEHVLPRDRARVYEGMVTALMRGGPFTLAPHEFTRPDGGVLRLEIEAIAEQGPQGRSTRVWGVIQDVSRVRHHDSSTGPSLDVDPLTGVGTRRSLERSLTRLPEGGIVLLIDLDQFHVLNEELGQRDGDRILERFGAVLRDVTRASDTVARFGGEEFVVLAAGAASAGARLFTRLRATWQATGAPVTFTAGLAVRRADEAPHVTLQRADASLVAGKAAGRDRLVSADPEQTASVVVDLRSSRTGQVLR